MQSVGHKEHMPALSYTKLPHLHYAFSCYSALYRTVNSYLTVNKAYNQYQKWLVNPVQQK